MLGGGTVADIEHGRCCAHGCDRPCNVHYVFCPSHWDLVPVPIKERIFRAYTKGQELGRLMPSRWWIEAVKAARLRVREIQDGNQISLEIV
jgi:hypothetical protein